MGTPGNVIWIVIFLKSTLQNPPTESLWQSAPLKHRDNLATVTFNVVQGFRAHCLGQSEPCASAEARRIARDLTEESYDLLKNCTHGISQGHMDRLGRICKTWERPPLTFRMSCKILKSLRKSVLIIFLTSIISFQTFKGKSTCHNLFIIHCYFFYWEHY